MTNGVHTWKYAPNLRRIRGALSMERAAALVGVTRGTWFAWEHGTTTPTIDNALAIVEAFNCPPELVGYVAPESSEFVPAAWIIQQHEQISTALRDLQLAVERVERLQVKADRRI